MLVCCVHLRLLVQELFEECGNAADAEAEFIAPVLLKRAGGGSSTRSGHDSIIAVDADAALITMVQMTSESRVRSARLLPQHTNLPCFTTLSDWKTFSLSSILLVFIVNQGLTASQ